MLLENYWDSLPAWVKIIGFLGVWGSLWLPLAMIVGRGYGWRPFEPLTPQQKLPLLGCLYLIAPLLFGLVLNVEGSTLSHYGLAVGGLFASLGWGFAIAIFSLILIYGLETQLGWLRWEKANFANISALILPLLMLGLWIGITEEALFRGLFLTQLQTDFSPLIATLLSSLIFALLHLLWERKQTLPQLPGLWLMGIVLAWARWLDNGSLGLAWGLHAGWIWGLSLLDAAELFTYTGNIPEWMTGMGKQPLAGVMGWVCLLITALVIGQLPHWGFL